MRSATSKWLAYTFLVGLIPVLTRLLAWLITPAGTVHPIATQDLLAFGLVLHASIINELEHDRKSDRSWKSIQNGTAVLFVALYGAVYTLTVVGERIPGLIDMNAAIRIAFVLTSASALLCLAVFQHLAR